MVRGVYAWCKDVMPQPADWQAQRIGEGKGRKWPATGVRVPEGGSDAEKGLVFSDAKKEREKRKEVCFRLKREIPSKCHYFKLSLMCNLQSPQVHLESEFLSPPFLL